MNEKTARRVIEVMHNTPQIETVDITGQNPEHQTHSISL
jgi:hypothetical protein